MRIVRLTAEGVPGVGRLELRPGTGIVGWTGTSPTDRELLRRLLGWAAGLDPSDDEGSRATARAPARAAELELAVAGTTCVTRREASDPGPVAESDRPERRLGVRPQELAAAWLGFGAADPDRLVGTAARMLARARGGTRIEAALERIGSEHGEPGAGSPGPGSRTGPRPGSDAATRAVQRARREAELEEVEERLEGLADVPRRLRELEEELASLRADAAEVEGDIEAETTDWLRRRQDAETHLESYRARARELRERMRELEAAGPDGSCPFCRRPLGERYEQVIAELDDEWERLVQDGSWWRRRRDQLDEKPARVRELEDRSVRLRAEVEACAERLERRRFELRERDELRHRRRELLQALGRRSPGPERESGEGRRRRILEEAFRHALRELIVEERAALLSAAGTHLNRISGGRLLAVVEGEGGGVVPVEDGALRPDPAPPDRAALSLALRVALVLRLDEAGAPLGSLVAGEPFLRLESDARVRILDLLREHAGRIPQVMVLPGDVAVRTSPERFDRIVELRPEGGGGRSRIRVRPGGTGRLRIVVPSPPDSPDAPADDG